MHQLVLTEMVCASACYNVGDGVRMTQVQLKEMVRACARRSCRRWCAHAQAAADGDGVRLRQRLQMMCACANYR